MLPKNLDFIKFPPVTITFVAICIFVSLISKLGEVNAVIVPLLIDNPFTSGFDALAGGQIWRLVTPIFIHFGLLHIIFNMMWLWDLGTSLERLHGSIFVFAFVIIVGIASNLGQFLLGSSPFFGGMSGVVYGLLGYAWILSWRLPHLGITLHMQVVLMMLVWFVVCWLGIVGPIANWAHTFGLVLGICAGGVATLRHVRKP